MGFVGPGLALVGTVVGIADRNNAAAQRNAQIAEQQRAEYMAQHQRTVSLAVRQQFAAQQAELELLANYSRATQQLSAVEMQLQSAKMQAASAFLGTQQALTQAEVDQLRMQAEARNTKFAREQEGYAVALQASQEAQQELNQTSQLYNQLASALAQGNVAVANTVAQSLAARDQGSKQGSGNAQQTVTDNAMRQSMINSRNYEIGMQLLKGGAADEQTIMDLVNSLEFQNILKETGIVEANSLNSQAQILRAMRQSVLNAQNEGVQAGLTATIQGLNSLYEAIPRDAQIRNNQTLINQGFQDIYLKETQAGNMYNYDSRIAGLESQKAYTSPLSDLFSIASAGYPLISGMFTSQERAASPLTTSSNFQYSFMTPNEIARTTTNVGELHDNGFSGKTIPYFDLSR